MRECKQNYLIKSILGTFLTIVAAMSVNALPVMADEPHKHNEVTFETQLSKESNVFPTESGNYYLTSNIVLTEGTTYTIGAEDGKNPVTVNLCLNGYSIIGAENTNITINKDSALNIYDCNSDSEYYFKKASDAEYWVACDAKDEGAREISGGVITGFINKGVFNVNKGSLSIFGGTIVGNMSNSGNTPGGAVTNISTGTTGDVGTVNVNGGAIIGNESKDQNGGAVYISGGSINMLSGEISNNYAKYGGGVYLAGNSTFNLAGGTIKDNHASSDGGGVYIDSNNAFFMTGGTISANVANGGGGIYNSCAVSTDDNISVFLRGGEITGNVVKTYGAGVYCKSDSKICVGGTVKVYDNIAQNTDPAKVLNQSNIHLANSGTTDAQIKFLEGNYAPKDGADIRVTVYYKNSDSWKPDLEISKYFTNLTDTNCKYVTMTNSALNDDVADNTSFEVIKQGDGFVLLDPNREYSITSYNSDGHEIKAYKNASDNTELAKSKYGETIIIKVTPAKGYEVIPDQVYVFRYGGGLCAVTANSDGTYSFVMPNANVSFYAEFNQINFSEVTAEPIGAELTFNGQPQILLASAGEAMNGTMVYCLGADSTTIPPEDAKWSAEIPTGTDAGDYFVWYKSKGDEGYTDSEINSLCRVSVKIEKCNLPTDKVDSRLNGLKAVKPSTYGASDGKISGTDADMLYTTQNNSTTEYNMVAHGIRCTSGEVTNLPAGTYYVFIYPASGNYYQSKYVTIVIPDGDRPNPTPTATPTVTPTATPTATPTVTPTATPSATPTATPSATPTVTPATTPSATPSPTPSAIPTPVPHVCEGIRVDEVPATCTQTGTKAYYKCECQKSYEDEACTKEIVDLASWLMDENGGKIAAKGHTAVIDKAVTATAKKNGLTEGTHCPVCNTVLKAQLQTVYSKTGIVAITSKNAVTYVAPVKTSIKTIEVPATVKIKGKTYKVTSILEGAFTNCKKLTNVKTGSNVKIIGDDAFKGCKNLTSVTIGSKVTNIGADAFYGCTKLKTVTIGKSVKTIGANAFGKCTSLTEIVIPDNVIEIGANSFEGCTGLKTVTIGKAVKTIETKAFKGCKRLTSVKILSGKITVISKDAFKGISSKAKITVPSKKVSTYKKFIKASGAVKVSIIKN